MTQPITQQQIAEIKGLADSGVYYGTDCTNGNVLSLIATLEARENEIWNAAIDAACNAIDGQIPIKEINQVREWVSALRRPELENKQ